MASPLLADEKDAVFQELKGLTIPPVKPGFSKVEQPLEIEKKKDLKIIFGKGKDMMTLRKSVDFEKRKVLLFRWNGSGKDTLSARVEPNPKEGAKPEVIFDYAPGLTRDLRFHAKAFALPKDAKWKVVRGKPALVKAVVQVGPRPVPLARVGAQIRIVAGQAVVKVKPAVVQKRVPPPPPVLGGGVIRGGIKPGIQINRRIPVRGISLRIYKQWTGYIEEGKIPSLELPPKGYVIDEDTWTELWHAWRPTEEVPEVNFRNELVLVGAMPNKSRVYVRASRTNEGEVTMSINGSGNTTGLCYSFAKVMRAGLVSINGARLPGAPD
ncbi:MAG: hypothetical protein VCA36_06165 [Opitutales bacterium]